MTIRIAIAGAAGRMGTALVLAVSQRQDISIVGASERPSSHAIGVEIAPGVTILDDVARAAKDADVWIDFTTPDATQEALIALGGTGVRAAVIGTTGITAETDAAIADASKRLAIVRSGNFSLGVNILAGLVRQAAERLGPEWDIEIVEAHHRRKVDAPSGTALMLGEAAAAGRGKSLHDLRLDPREGITGSRAEGGIGFAVVRGGGIVGEHEVIFAAESESLRFSHVAGDRSLFAHGAVHAALWAATQKPGLYSMQDVLGL
jgi:4-hydroxy-tetrahydrodipicolinate reductase